MFHHELLKQDNINNSTPPPQSSSSGGLSSLPMDSSSNSSVAASPYWGESTTSTNKPEGFSPFIGFCFTINYILGTGFLTIPWAFAQGGLVLSTIVIVVVGIFSDMSKNYILETMARSETMLDNTMHWIKRNPGDEEKSRLVYSPVIMMVGTPTPTAPSNTDNNNNNNNNETRKLLTAAATYDYEALALPNKNKGGSTTKTSYTKASSFGATTQSATATPISGSLPSTPIGSAPGTPQRHHRGGRQLLKKPKYLIKHRKFEVNTLCRIFLGKKFGLRIYTTFICLYIYCTLWAYTCVFASAMAKAFPILKEITTTDSNSNNDDETNYLIYALIFAGMVVPLSCMELDEQVVIQVIMTGARFLMFFLMLGTSNSAAAQAATTVTIDDDPTKNSVGSSYEPVPLIRWEGIDKMLPIMVFAQIYHHSIPGLAQPVANKKQLSGIFRSTTAFSTIAYVLLGLTVAEAFGMDVAQSSNLLWNDFTGSTWANMISFYVVCFPALDVISAFPLNAITLGNNMLGSVYGSKSHEVEHNRWIRTRFRLLASIPPIILAIIQRQLGKITDYAGTTGFIIGFSFPALLYIRSRAMAKKKHFATTTYYESYASSTTLAWFLFGFGISMVIYVLLWLVKDSNSSNGSVDEASSSSSSSHERNLFRRF